MQSEIFKNILKKLILENEETFNSPIYEMINQEQEKIAISQDINLELPKNINLDLEEQITGIDQAGKEAGFRTGVDFILTLLGKEQVFNSITL